MQNLKSESDHICKWAKRASLHRSRVIFKCFDLSRKQGKSSKQGIPECAVVQKQEKWLSSEISPNHRLNYCVHDLRAIEKLYNGRKKERRKEIECVIGPPTGLSFCIKGTCRVQSRQWWCGWRWRQWWRWTWGWRWLIPWWSCWHTLIRADWVDPERLKPLVTFLRNGALLVGLHHVLAAAAPQSFILQEFIHPLDDALQTLIHVHPHLLLSAREKYRGYLVYILVILR